MSDLPKITIVTTSYNQKQYLEEAITSVLDQKYPNLEYIICDGASKDGSVDIIRKYEKHLAHWYSEKDGGQPNALNNGFGRATGDIFGFINSDDVLLPGSLNFVADQFQKGAKWIVGWVKFVEPDNQEWPQLIRTIDSPVDWFTSNPLPQQSTFWLGKYTRELGPFRTDLQYVFDYEFWLRMKFVAGVSPQIVRRCMGTYRLHETSKTVSETGKYPAEFQKVRDEYAKYLTPKQLATVQRFVKSKKYNVYREMALKGLNTGDVSGARRSALKLLRHQAGSLESWRVAFHAIRGH